MSNGSKLQVNNVEIDVTASSDGRVEIAHFSCRRFSRPSWVAGITAELLGSGWSFMTQGEGSWYFTRDKRSPGEI
jgi:hypothetical protein